MYSEGEKETGLTSFKSACKTFSRTEQDFWCQSSDTIFRQILQDTKWSNETDSLFMNFQELSIENHSWASTMSQDTNDSGRKWSWVEMIKISAISSPTFINTENILAIYWFIELLSFWNFGDLTWICVHYL